MVVSNNFYFFFILSWPKTLQVGPSKCLNSGSIIPTNPTLCCCSLLQCCSLPVIRCCHSLVNFQLLLGVHWFRSFCTIWLCNKWRLERHFLWISDVFLVGHYLGWWVVVVCSCCTQCILQVSQGLQRPQRFLIMGEKSNICHMLC